MAVALVVGGVLLMAMIAASAYGAVSLPGDARILLPVRDEQVRAAGPDRFLVPERAFEPRLGYR